MTTAFDTRFRALARKLIDGTFGTSATLRTFAESYDVATGKNTRTATDRAVTISPPAPVAESRISGVVEAGDAECYVAALSLSVRPSTEDVLESDAREWQVVQVNPVVSGDEKAAYRLVIRS